MKPARAGVALSLALASLLAASGCSAGAGAGAAGSFDDLSGTLTVFAAASLTDTFDALAETFEREHPSVDVVLNYAGSAALAQQVVAGAPADVFAAASEPAMGIVVAAGLAADPVSFATNTLEIVVPAGNPKGVAGLADLARPELAVALCDPTVPCGAAAQTLLDDAGARAAADTLEQDVKAVLTKVLLGEADAGLVYVTDVRAAGEAVEGVIVPGAQAVVNTYPVAAITGAANRRAAAAWIALLVGPEGRAALREAGFGAP